LKSVFIMTLRSCSRLEKSRCILASWRGQLDIWFQLAKIRLTTLGDGAPLRFATGSRQGGAMMFSWL
jgi:hypothetical protein